MSSFGHSIDPTFKQGPIIDQCRQASLFGSNNTVRHARFFWLLRTHTYCDSFLQASTFWGGSSGDSLTPDEATDCKFHLFLHT